MRVRTVALWLVLLVLAAGSSRADTVLTLDKREGPASAPPESAIRTETTIWIGAGRIREDRPKQSVVIDRRAGKLWVLRHDTRTYHEINLPIDVNTLVPAPMLKALREHGAKMEMQLEITPTDERRTIAELPTRKFVVHAANALGMTMDVDLWTTTAIQADVDGYKQLTLEMAKFQAMGTNWIEQLMAIEGFPVLREMKVTQGGREHVTREELVKVEKREPPKGFYGPAVGYALTPLDMGPPQPQP